MLNNILRFQLYTDPSRTAFTQLQPDEEVNALPQYGYGQRVQIDDNTTSSSEYVVANLSRIKREHDAEGNERIVYEVYLARAVEWDQSYD